MVRAATSVDEAEQMADRLIRAANRKYGGPRNLEGGGRRKAPGEGENGAVLDDLAGFSFVEIFAYRRNHDIFHAFEEVVGALHRLMGDCYALLCFEALDEFVRLIRRKINN